MNVHTHACILYGHVSLIVTLSRVAARFASGCRGPFGEGEMADAAEDRVLLLQKSRGGIFCPPLFQTILGLDTAGEYWQPSDFWKDGVPSGDVPAQFEMWKAIFDDAFLRRSRTPRRPRSLCRS